MKSHTLYILVIAALVLAFFMREGCQRRAADSLISNLLSYKDSVAVERLKNGSLIYTNKQLEVSTQKQMQAFAASINDTLKRMAARFKSLSNVTYLTNNFISTGDTARVSDSIPCDFAPVVFRAGSDSTYRLKGTVYKKVIVVDSISITDHESLVFGRKRVGFMKYDHSVDVNHSNAIMRTSAIKSFQFTPQKRWYERTWVHLIAGAVLQTGVIKGVNALFSR